jgi:hypothetical protein
MHLVALRTHTFHGCALSRKITRFSGAIVLYNDSSIISSSETSESLDAESSNDHSLVVEKSTGCERHSFFRTSSAQSSPQTIQMEWRRSEAMKTVGRVG